MKELYVFIVLILLSLMTHGQEITSYELNVKIDVESENIQVKGLIDIDFKNNDSISLVLWKNSTIHSITSNQSQVRFYFDSVSTSPIMYVPDGRNLIIYKPGKSTVKQFFLFDYECDMHKLYGWGRSFSEYWLNEAFAEYSMLIYFRNRLGSDIFNAQIEEYKSRTKGTPHIWRIYRDAQEAYTVLY
jgi:hypothetical protein